MVDKESFVELVVPPTTETPTPVWQVCIPRVTPTPPTTWDSPVKALPKREMDSTPGEAVEKVGADRLGVPPTGVCRRVLKPRVWPALGATKWV